MRYTMVLAAAAAIAASLSMSLGAAKAQAQSESDIPFAAGLATELAALREEYEARIRALEAQLEALQAQSAGKPAHRGQDDGHGHAQDEHGHEADRDMAAHEDEGELFNPRITAVIRGLATSYSADDSELAGFRLGHEGERAPEGFSLDHSELTLSSDISDAVRGSLSLGIDAHPGEPAEVEVEEAYVQTLPGAGLPVSLKAGRALWKFGYLNERHAHEDDFADRSLPYRAYLDNAFNDDGVQISLGLPGGLGGEVGGGAFRGDDHPFGGSDNGRRAWSAFARMNGDLGRDSSWRVGASLLNGKVIDGADDHAHEEEGEHVEEEGDEHHEPSPASLFSQGMFTGDRRLYAVDASYAFAPTGDTRQSKVTLLGEYLWLEEDGVYEMTDDEMEEHELEFDGRSSGWYVQAVYKFLPELRVGARYSRLTAPSAAELGHDPRAIAVMADWTDSRFGLLRLQYNREDLAAGEADDQVILQYTVSLGSDGHADDHGH